MKECRGEVLWRSVVEKCCREAFVKKCCREVLERSAVAKRCGEVLQRSVVEKCCREVL